MMFGGLLLGGVGFVGLAGSSVLFPLLSFLGVSLGGAKSSTRGGAGGSLKRSRRLRAVEQQKLKIVIPVYNDPENLERTLSSVTAAGKYAVNHFDLSVTVVDDGSEKSVSYLSAQYPQVEFVRFEQNRGKWAALRDAVHNTRNCDWLGFVDAGTVWPFRFLEGLAAQFVDSELAGLAPGYRSPCKGRLQGVHWKIEAWLKSFENLSGGPVSVHGATVFYRFPLLKRAFRFLQGAEWRNDDVVIPLAIRSGKFVNRIEYVPSAAVFDYEVPSTERKTRERMTCGNLEWISQLLFPTFRRSPLVGIVALRRAFRTFWVYWVGFFGLGAALALFGSPALIAALIAVFLLAAAHVFQVGGFGVKALGSAAVSSLKSPFQLARLSSAGGSAWR